MDKSALEQAIVRIAKTDCFDGIGRLFIDQFTKEFNISREEVLMAIEQLPHEHRMANENVVLIVFAPREKRIPIIKFDQPYEEKAKDEFPIGDEETVKSEEKSGEEYILKEDEG